MKPFFPAVFLGILLVLSGCGGSDENSQVLPDTTEFQTLTVRNISLQLPTTWDMSTREQNPQEFPPGILLFASAVEPWGKRDTFATVAMAEEELPIGTSARKYIEAVINKTENEIVQYEKIEETNLQVSGNEAKLLHFTGKQTLDDETLEWQHLFVAANGRGYIVSSTAPLDASSDQKDLLKTIVTSLSFADNSAN